MKLTPRQEDILTFLESYQRENKIPPSTRVVQKHFGFGSQTSVIRHLKALADKGAIEQLADGSWGVKTKPVQPLIEIPVYGEIPAGIPATREQESAERIAVDPRMFGQRLGGENKMWGLRIKGDSMIGAQIRDGDIGVFVRRNAGLGEIVAALVDQSVTLKRLMKVHGKLVLHAENKKYADITPASGLEIQGVLVGLIRNSAL